MSSTSFKIQNNFLISNISLGKTGIEVDETRLSTLIGELEGKDLAEVSSRFIPPIFLN